MYFIDFKELSRPPTGGTRQGPNLQRDDEYAPRGAKVTGDLAGGETKVTTFSQNGKGGDSASGSFAG
jgi:hypothetical protein